MRSNKRSEASRRNGANSTGPITPEGKASSSQNAARHNLCAGHIVLLSNEDEEEFHNVRDQYFQRFQPIDCVEVDLVHKLVAATWRERRVTAMETALFEVEMVNQQSAVAAKYLELSPEAHQTLILFGNGDTRAVAVLLFRYGSAARRTYAAAMKTLRDLQGDRFNRQPESAPVQAPASGPIPLQPARQARPGQTPPPHAQPAARASALIILRRHRERLTADRHNAKLQNEPKRAAAAGAYGAGFTLIHGDE